MKVFISYRREDTAPYAGRLYDRLRECFGPGNVFIDVDTIQPGDDFVAVIEKTLAVCDVVVALIGKHWLDCIDPAGRRRIDSPEDFVRLEITAALNQGVRFIPVVVGDAVMPSAAQLPEAISTLARRQAAHLSDSRFHEDVSRLIVVIEATGEERSQAKARRSFWLRRTGWAIIALILALAAGVTYGLFSLAPKADAPKSIGTILDLWTGDWDYVCQTKLGDVRGKILIRAGDPPQVNGTYNDRTISGVIVGRIEGVDHDILAGTWRNRLGQVGQFRFKLGPGRTSFRGSYSMSLDSPPPDQANYWNGSRWP